VPVSSLLSAALLSGALAFAGCATSRTAEAPLLATAGVAADFDSYSLARVGLLPLDGANLDDGHAALLQGAFYAELSRATPYELVPLDAADLAEVRGPDPHRLGVYDPRTVVEVARRYRLDGILAGTVTHRRDFPPQELSVLVDLVAAETGLVIWEAAVHLDARDPRVTDGIVAWAAEAETSGEDSQVALLSPARFAGFAAWQIARLL
jgi:hypothetical protein